MLSKEYSDLIEVAKKLSSQYSEASPFPHIVIDNFFKSEFIELILNEFPDLSKIKVKSDFDFQAARKFAQLSGDDLHGTNMKTFLRYCNSSSFIDFLQILTSIKEPLIPDPHFVGGGIHEIKRGGFLKIHCDFSKHPENDLDRRINLLFYLNKNWEKDYGGEIEFWDKDMKNCVKKIDPIFNRLVIFNTNDFTYHGHPIPLNCPQDRSRKSLALYYFSNGRPTNELRPQNENPNTIYRHRPGENFMYKPKYIFRELAKDFIPPFFQRNLKTIFRNK
tara:strand:- start:4788 stop:5615 length:828 start_codon:yes stop_codon:yes gene_type:complete